MPPPRNRPTVASKSTSPSKTIGCCNKTFSSNQAYENHLLLGGNHFACKYCLADHRTVEGLKRHMNQMHAAEQKLECIGCKKTFNRAGGLVAHIQFKECPYLKGGYIEDLKAKDPCASGMFDLIREVHSWEGAEYHKLDGQPQLIGTLPTESHTISKDVLAFDTSVQKSAADEENDLISFDTVATASMIMNAPWDQPTVNFNADLDFPALVPISNNVATTPKISSLPSKSSAKVPHALIDSSITMVRKQPKSVTQAPQELNHFMARSPATAVSHAPAVHAWNTSKPPMATPVSAAAAWDAISSKPDAAASSIPATSAWDAKISKSSSVTGATAAPAPAWGNASSHGPASTVLFPNAPPAIAPPAYLMDNLSIHSTPPEPMYGEHHPDNPNFDARRYYNKFSQKYKCPHSVKCKDKESVSAFIQHLLSPIHQDHDKVTCQRCLRVFVNATAFVQHFESQALRCDARILGNAGEVVRVIAQVVTTEGERHEDETVKYINTPGLVFNPQDSVAGMGEASHQAAKARAEYQKNRWSKTVYTNW